MKLKNKKTGEIIEVLGKVSFVKRSDNDMGSEIDSFNSLAGLNEEWEDYEEPKEYWYYDTTKNGVEKITHLEDKEKDQEIGNYFETKEEAEKAVEKLKAFKRLQDLGFKFEGIRFRSNHNYIEWKVEPKNEFTDHDTGELLKGLHKVFGGSDDN